MIHEKLLRPRSIVVVGASNNVTKPGGKVIKNLLDHQYKGDLFAVNPKESSIQGIPSFTDVSDLPDIDLAILAIPARFCLDAVTELAEEHDTKAFIIISAGFGEQDAKGKELEKQIVEVVNKNGACLIGPNCIGVMTPYHSSVPLLPAVFQAAS